MVKYKEKNICKDMKCLLCISGLVVIALASVMIFSPLALQFGDEGMSRGTNVDWELDSLVEIKKYRVALNRVDSIIKEKGCVLPRIAYFDRFLPEKERYDVSMLRAEIYELQWKRIEILQATNNKDALKVALEKYCGIIGYNQERAKSLLNQINKR